MLTLSLYHQTTVLFSQTLQFQNHIAVSQEMTNAFGPDALYLPRSTPVTGDRAAYYTQRSLMPIESEKAAIIKFTSANVAWHSFHWRKRDLVQSDFMSQPTLRRSTTNSSDTIFYDSVTVMCSLCWKKDPCTSVYLKKLTLKWCKHHWLQASTSCQCPGIHLHSLILGWSIYSSEVGKLKPRGHIRPAKQLSLTNTLDQLWEQPPYRDTRLECTAKKGNQLHCFHWGIFLIL